MATFVRRSTDWRNGTLDSWRRSESCRSDSLRLSERESVQAAPFSKGNRAAKPRRPGRKPGTGSFSFRKPPSHNELTEPITDVSVSAESCPGCGGALEHEGVGYAYVTDIPPMPRPEVKGYRVQICRCQSCGKRVRGRHREVAPDQYGASAHRMGRRVMSAAHVLHHSAGVPVRKIPSILRTLTGVKITQSAITQDALRRAKGEVGDAYRSCAVRCAQVRSYTPTTRAGVWAESLLT